MLDKDFIKMKIEYIQRDLNRLEPMAKLTIDKLAQDDFKYAALKNFLMEIIGRAIDINEHIIAEKGGEKLNAPLQYRETFLCLVKMGILPEDFAQEIAKSTGFRNAIVHNYNNLDKYITYQSVKDAITQYTQYCSYILNFIKTAN